MRWFSASGWDTLHQRMCHNSVVGSKWQGLYSLNVVIIITGFQLQSVMYSGTPNGIYGGVSSAILKKALGFYRLGTRISYGSGSLLLRTLQPGGDWIRPGLQAMVRSLDFILRAVGASGV